MRDTRPGWLILTQVYPPDPASVGQHIADVAAELVARGRRVRVYTARRGYDDPAARYPWREVRAGVEIRRLPFSSFGKRSMAVRMAGAVIFTLQCVLLCLFARRVRGIIFSTVPPFIGIAAYAARLVRRIPIAYWVMDMNPDQLVALGQLSAASLPGRVLERVNRRLTARSEIVIALDRFMAAKLERKAPGRRIEAIPPWPHEDHISPVARAANPFRARHGLEGKFVVMYSGNHSPSNPLTTVIEAAVRLRDHPDVRFLFVGGGVGKREVEAAVRRHGLENVRSLPYQPLDQLAASLSAGDVHVVSLGAPMVGIIHPCKVYGAMAAGRPVLFIGPAPSHLADLLDHHGIGWRIAHGDADGCVRSIERLAAMDRSELDAIGREAWAALRAHFSQALLCGRLCDALEAGIGARSPGRADGPAPTAARSIARAASGSAGRRTRTHQERSG